MLDLAFVRDKLPLIEEKLRQRGMDAADLLAPFKAFDAERRELIHRAESLQAAQNAQSKEIARLMNTTPGTVARPAPDVAQKLRTRPRQPRRALVRRRHTAHPRAFIAPDWTQTDSSRRSPTETSR